MARLYKYPTASVLTLLALVLSFIVTMVSYADAGNSRSLSGAVSLPVSTANGGTGAASLAAANICVTTSNATCTIPQATTTVALDFSTDSVKTITASGGTSTFTTANLAAGRSVMVIVSCTSSTCTMAHPAWIFVGAAADTSVAVNKHMIYSLYSTSTTDGAVYASQAEEP